MAQQALKAQVSGARISKSKIERPTRHKIYKSQDNWIDIKSRPRLKEKKKERRTERDKETEGKER